MQEDLFQIERVTSNHIQWKSGQKEKICELYNNGYSLRKISECFNGLHRTTIKKILTENNICLRTKAESHYKDNRNTYIFNQIDTEEKAYWLGFLAADGCVHQNYIIITLQKRDIDHLEKFKKFLNADSVKIQEYSQQTSYSNQSHDYVRFSIGCKQMAQDLKKHGIKEAKSLILSKPNIDEKFYYDWLRGYFDGDGCISYSKKDNQWQSNVLSTKEVCQWIITTLQLNTKPYQQQHNGKISNVWVVHFNGRKNVYNAWNKMFKNDSATIYLERKYKLYKILKNTFIET